MKTVAFDFFPEKTVIAGYTADFDGAWNYNSPDDLAHYEHLAEAYGVSADRLVRVHQKHTDRILAVDASNGGEGVSREGTADFYDGMITDTENLMLCIITADCVPVLLYDAAHNAVGIVHSGKVGTEKEVAAKAVLDMKARFGTDPATLRCILGPYISQKHYQLQKKDILPFESVFSPEERERFITSDRDGYYVDLGEAIGISLEKVGVKRSRIFDCRTCTFENKDLFSYRRDRYYKHILSFIMLKKECHE